jgi:transposase
MSPHQEFFPRRPKVEPINRQQLLLRTVDIEQLVPEDDPVRAIWELSGRLDLKRFYEAIQTEEGESGREAIDPRLLICLWVYAYSQGISSAREVSHLMEYPPGFQWLSGMRVINHHTLSDFRIRHGQALDELFTQLLGVLSSEGLLTLERVMHDGTKVKANAGGDSFRRGERLQKHVRLAKEHVAAMGDPRNAEEVTPRLKAARARTARQKQERLQQALQELEKVRSLACHQQAPEEVRVSRTDPEARVMKLGDGGYGPAYNVQLSTDAAAGAIVFTFIRPDSYEQIDVFLQNPVDFDGFFTRRKIFRIDEIEIAVPALADLKVMKRIAARDKDKADLKHLEKLEDLDRGH